MGRGVGRRTRPPSHPRKDRGYEHRHQRHQRGCEEGMATPGRWPGRMGARHARRAIRAAEGRHPRLELWRGSGGGVPERASVRRQKRRRADTHQGRRPAHRRGEGVSEAGERRKICLRVTFASAVVLPTMGTRNIWYVPKLGNTTSGVPKCGNTTLGMFPNSGTQHLVEE